ncbi:MAG TPA: hypothetical protein VNE62_06555 [Actinomycetota bacterium]|nr:hypothetical protein [Actinomycetota bacterium]
MTSPPTETGYNAPPPSVRRRLQGVFLESAAAITKASKKVKAEVAKPSRRGKKIKRPS